MLDTTSMHCVNVVDPDGHPDALVACLDSQRAKRHLVRTYSAAALTALAKEDLALTGTNASKRWRASPLPGFCPAELFKPTETLSET